MLTPFWIRFVLLLGGALLLVPHYSSAQEVTLSSHHTAPVGEAPTALAFSSEGEFLLVGGEDGQIEVWEVAEKTKIVQLRRSEEVHYVGFLRGDTSFVVVDRSGEVSVANVDGGEAEARFHVGDSPEMAALDAGRRYLAVATGEERIELFDLQTRTRIGRIDARGQLDDLLFLGFDRLGKLLAAITKQGTVLTWNPKTQRQLREMALSGGDLHGSQSVIKAAATDRGADVLVVGLQEVALPDGGVRRRARPGDLDRQNVLIAYDWETGLEIKRVSHEDGPAQQIALGPGSDHAAVTTGEPPRLTLVHLRRGETGSTVPLSEAPSVLTVSENDQRLAVGTEDGRLTIWTVEREKRPTAGRHGEELPALSGRIRVVSEEAPAIPSDRSVRLAVLPFTSKGESTKVAETCSNELVTQLANVDHLALVERERIEEVLDELDLQASDLTESGGARVGRLLNADVLVLGNVNVLGANYLFNARLLNVETGQITEGRQVICEECKFRDVFEAIHLLGSTIARQP